MKRRSFVKSVSATTVSALLAPYSLAQLGNKASLFYPDWSHGMPPLFCVAYIDPGIISQQGQEEHVAKYPIALVPQDNRGHFRRWRDKVKNLNPDIKLIGYQMVIEETGVPGPGHEILRTVNNAWAEYPSGFQPKITFSTAKNKQFRVYDPRKKNWAKAFLDACEAVLASYPFDGLFLDQCTIYAKAATTQAEREEMFEALQSVILELRSKHPDKWIIGNSKYSWAGLNGEMNENRPNRIQEEVAIFEGHIEPRIELFHYYMSSHQDTDRAKELMRLALYNRAFFGAGINAQTVRWYPFMDEVINDYNQRPAKPQLEIDLQE